MRLIIDRESPAQAQVPVLRPRSDSPAEQQKHTIILQVCGKRYELITSHVKLREIRQGPAKVIEMPRRPAT
jgi:hypothetical protein